MSPRRVLPELYLCADGGGTSVNVSILSSCGILVKGSAGPSNVKTVGEQACVAEILLATRQALAQLPSHFDIDHLLEREDGKGDRMYFSKRIFRSIWLGLAGIMQRSDVDLIAPYVVDAFKMGDAGEDLKITNDGHLLASPCLRIPHIDSAIALVAGTGTVGLSFKKVENRVEQVGVSKGWGYLLCDEGSAYSIGRLAIRSILAEDDIISSCSFLTTPSTAPRKDRIRRLGLHQALMDYFEVKDGAELIDRVYSNHWSSTSGIVAGEGEKVERVFASAIANRKVWMAEATRVVFRYAFGASPPSSPTGTEPHLVSEGDRVEMEEMDDEAESRQAAIEIAKIAIQPLIDIVRRLSLPAPSLLPPLSASEPRPHPHRLAPSKSVLSLGGGLFKVAGYKQLLLDGLLECGLVFAEVIIVGDASEEGVMVLSLRGQS